MKHLFKISFVTWSWTREKPCRYAQNLEIIIAVRESDGALAIDALKKKMCRGAVKKLTIISLAYLGELDNA